MSKRLEKTTPMQGFVVVGEARARRDCPLAARIAHCACAGAGAKGLKRSGAEIRRSDVGGLTIGFSAAPPYCGGQWGNRTTTRAR